MMQLYVPNPNEKQIVEQPIILLNFIAMEKETNAYKMDVVAHEVAHYILRHHKSNPSSKKGFIQQEKVADDLIESWDFNRTNESEYHKS